MWRGPIRRLFLRRGAGFTLLETLITLALFSMVIVGVYLLYTTMQNTLSRGELKADLQQNARIAMDQIVQEIRMAGYDPSGAIPAVNLLPKAAIRAATNACLSFVSYRRPTPTTEASAQITYFLDVPNQILRRRADNWNASNGAFCLAGGAQPLAESVDLLAFTYYDAYNQIVVPPSHPCPLQNNPCAPPTDPHASAEAISLLNQIRRVGITIRTRDSRPNVFSEAYTVTGDVRLRNR